MRASDYQSAEAWYDALNDRQKWAADNTTTTLDRLWRTVCNLEAKYVYPNTSEMLAGEGAE